MEPKAIAICSRPNKMQKTSKALPIGAKPAQAPQKKAKPIGARDALANKASNLMPVGADKSAMVPIGRVTMRCNATGLPIAQSSSSGASSSIFNALTPPWRRSLAKANPAYAGGRNPNEPPQ